jgi:hypothetical protein
MVFLSRWGIAYPPGELTGEKRLAFSGDVQYSDEETLGTYFRAFTGLPKHFFGSIQVSMLQLRPGRYPFRQINQIGKEFEPGLEKAIFVAFIYERSQCCRPHD